MKNTWLVRSLSLVLIASPVILSSCQSQQRSGLYLLLPIANR
ncbi:hypothetical protein QUA56_23745 [Microcoleus sp. N3A4]